MIIDLFSLREKEIFDTLKALKDCDFAVIGGYAVNAYALPRFSTDCDIVIKNEDELKKIGKVLLGIGYTQESLPKAALHYGSFLRCEKRIHNNFTVSMDILVKNVTDRMTGCTFSADWIFENSKARILKGKTLHEQLKLRVINMDALLVMKITCCRATDIRDVFMMLPNSDNKKWIQSEVSLRYNFNDRLSKIIEKVNSPQFKDGLSGVYGRFDQKMFEKHRKALLSLQNE